MADKPADKLTATPSPAPSIPVSAKRVDIISDTHGYLAPELLSELAGADLILHAGDIIHASDLAALEDIAPVYAVLGNNDYFGELPAWVQKEAKFHYEGLSFYMTHIKNPFKRIHANCVVYGHTHVPYVEKTSRGYEINPGSPTFPRSQAGATMARLWVKKGAVFSAAIVELG